MMKAYLGDAVYASISNFGELVLTTEDGIKATNTIVLEPSVVLELESYIKAWRSKNATNDRGR